MNNIESYPQTHQAEQQAGLINRTAEAFRQHSRKVIALAGIMGSLALATPDQAQAANTHTVQSGDSLSLIAEHHDTSLDNLLKKNPEQRVTPNIIHVGEKITIRKSKSAESVSKKSYRVHPGDSLSVIADDNNLSLFKVLKLNPKFKDDPNLIKPGQTVRLIPATSKPAKKPVSTPKPDKVTPPTPTLTQEKPFNQESADAITAPVPAEPNIAVSPKKDTTTKVPKLWLPSSVTGAFSTPNPPQEVPKLWLPASALDEANQNPAPEVPKLWLPESALQEKAIASNEPAIDKSPVTRAISTVQEKAEKNEAAEQEKKQQKKEAKEETNKKPAKLTKQDIAKKILSSGNVSIDPKYAGQITNLAEGKSDCYVNPTILSIITKISKAYKITISSLNRFCTNTLTASGNGSYHYREKGGHALDISVVDGQAASGGNAKDIELLKDVAPMLPSGSGIGQNNCRSTPINLPAGVAEFEDSCNHIHIQVPVN
ncbi:MAG: LysM peptidoglycan-binding domain-containing protein [Candidatus Saccharimonadales bacterium]